MKSYIGSCIHVFAARRFVISVHIFSSHCKLLSNKYIREDNYILVPYYTMSGEGLLKCIKPDIIFIDGIGYRGNVLIGFSDSPKLIDGVDVILHKDIMKG